MSGALRSISAMGVLVGLFLPGVLGIAAAAHVAEGHHHLDHERDQAEAVALIVHGHHHEPGTPAHQHTLVVANQAVLILKLSITHDLASSIHPEGTAPDLITRFPAVHGDLAHGPPVTARTAPILRI